MENNLELWRPIEGFNGAYEVSSLGRVRSLRFGYRILTIIINKGYSTVALTEQNRYCKKMQVHRLVAIAFKDKKEGKNFVNHINGIKSDNRAENLEWCTKSENMRHAYLFGLINKTRGKRRMLYDKLSGRLFNNISHAAKYFGVKYDTFYAALKRDKSDRFTLLSKPYKESLCQTEY